jgi:hypothetical protein
VSGERPGKVQVINAVMNVANEFSAIYTPDRWFIDSFTIQARDLAPLQIRFDGSEGILTLKSGGVYWEQGIHYNGGIHVSSDTPGTVVEAVLWLEPTGA